MRCWRRDSNPQGHLPPAALSTPCVCQLRHTSQTNRDDSGGRSRTPMTCFKDRRPPFRRPRTKVNPARLERAASGVADLRSDPSELRVQAEAVRLERTGARTPGGLARRCTAFCAAPPKKRKVWESNPQKRLSSDSFRDCLACPCPTFRRCIRRDSNPQAREEQRLYRPPARPIRRLMQNVDEGGRAGTTPAFVPQGNSVVKQQKKRSGPSASPEEAGPLRASLYELFRDLGSGRPPPAESIL